MLVQIWMRFLLPDSAGIAGPVCTAASQNLNLARNRNCRIWPTEVMSPKVGAP